MTNPGNRLTVEVGPGERFEDLATVSGGVAQANGVFHVVTPLTMACLFARTHDADRQQFCKNCPWCEMLP